MSRDALFDLIKALSPSEKRYFRQSLSGRGDKNYLRLLNVLDKMEVFDEATLKNAFKGERFAKQLHVTKIYLHDAILKSLRSFHAQSSSSIIIKDLLKNIEILFNKELYQLCAKEIKKAERVATKIEDDIALLEVLNWKRKVAQSLAPQTGDVREIIAAQKAHLEQIRRIHKAWELLLGMSTDGVPDPKEAMSLNEAVLLYHCKYHLEIQNGRNDQAKKHLDNLIKHLESNPDRIKEDPGMYFSTINNLLSFLVFTKQYNEALSLLTRAKTLYDAARAKQNANTFRQVLRMYNIELEIYRDIERLEKGIALINDIQNLIRQHSNNVPREYLISLWFQFAYLFFLQRDFKSSLRWINDILNSSFAHLRPDLHIQTHLLNLVVHFELRNFFVMRYFVDGTKRFIKKNRALRDYHKHILAFFSKVSSTPESRYPDLFGKLHADIVLTNQIPQHDLDYINWNKWISSKLKKARLNRSS